MLLLLCEFACSAYDVFACNKTTFPLLFLLLISSFSAATKALKLDQQQTAENHLFGLQLQGAIPKCVSETIENKNIETWATALDSLPSHLFNFARKALIQIFCPPPKT